MCLVGAVFLYRGLFNFRHLEAWYVVLYSVSSAIPFLMCGNVLQSFFTKGLKKILVVSVIYLLSAAASGVFVEANVHKRQQRRAKKMTYVFICFVTQLYIFLLSTVTEDFIWVIKKIDF